MKRKLFFVLLIVVIIWGIYIANIEEPTIVSNFGMAPISSNKNLAWHKLANKTFPYVQQGPLPEGFNWKVYQAEHPDELVVPPDRDSITIYINQKVPDYQYFKKSRFND